MTISSTPAYPIVGDKVTITLTDPLGNTIRGEVTSVPSTSKVVVGLTLDPATGLPIDYFIPDVPGVYGVRAHDWRTRTGIPSRVGDPVGASGVKYLATQEGTIAVGAVVTLPIATLRGHGATLRMTVVDATVRAAEFIAPLSEISRRACLDNAVFAAVQALVGVATTALDVDFVTDVAALRLAYQHHRIQFGGGTPVHQLADTTNIVRRDAPISIEAAIATLNELYDVIGAHETQGPSGGTWHFNDDGANNVVTAKARTLGQGVVTKADLRERVYERHRVTVGAGTVQVHANADSSILSAMDPPLPLPALIVAFLDAIVAASPATPAGEQVGMTHVENGLGFTRV